MGRPTVHLLDYVAGNIRSLVNAVEKCGYDVEWIKSPEDVKNAEVSVLLFHVALMSRLIRRDATALWSQEEQNGDASGQSVIVTASPLLSAINPFCSFSRHPLTCVLFP